MVISFYFLYIYLRHNGMHKIKTSTSSCATFFFNRDISAEVNNAWSYTFTPTHTFMACRRTTCLVPLPYIDYIFIEFIDFVMYSCIILTCMYVIKNFITIKSVFVAASLLHALAILMPPHLLLDADSM